jgi:hypothetical protein
MLYIHLAFQQQDPQIDEADYENTILLNHLHVQQQVHQVDQVFHLKANVLFPKNLPEEH